VVTELSNTPHVDDLIEELKRRTADLEAANRELRRVSHYRSLFLGRMSHELRTPLTSILGFCEILDRGPLLVTTLYQRFSSGLQLQASLDRFVVCRVEAGARTACSRYETLRVMRCGGGLCQKYQVD
jgi:signal transduction histidine kinase